MIDLLAAFKDMPEYAIMKIRDDFPKYTPGQDIDILCRDLEAVKIHLMRHLWDMVDFKVTRRSDKHIHVDVLKGNTIDIRFDLYSEYISWRFTTFAFRPQWGTGICTVTSYYDDMIKCYEYLDNSKEKYKDYAIYKLSLDAYR